MPPDLAIKLDWSELTIAANVGVLRQITNSWGKSKCGAISNPWAIHIEGAAAECAVSKALNLYWNIGGKSNKYAGAVGGHEVRYTHRDSGGLVVYAKNDPARKYILVTGTAPEYIIRGWISGHDAQRAEYWQTSLKIPAHLVPQEALSDVRDLVDHPIGHPPG